MGFVAARQKGSHVFFKHPDGRTTTVPRHRGTRPCATFNPRDPA
ncbi:MAG: type II toxin-antitoxin system HicA family toxin [Candidatus Binataceae bacterium]